MPASVIPRNAALIHGSVCTLVDTTHSGALAMKISAIVCTHNRKEYLRKSLASLAAQTLPVEDYEIIAVDNASSDGTGELVQREYSHIENLRYVYEPVLGLSRARNTGFETARSEYVAFLDDDAVAEPDWLEMIVRALAGADESVVCVGGRVDPIWEADRPEWLADALLPCLSVLDRGPSPVVLPENQHFVGANMAFRRSVLASIGGFSTNLGRKGGNLLSNEESLLRRRLIRSGYHCLYYPAARVGHHVPADRLSRKWFARRLFWQGISRGVMVRHLETLSANYRVRASLMLALRLRPWRYIASSLQRDDPEAFARRCDEADKLGYIFGLLGRYR
ncbi:MAG TPA: glycosyltransferase [Longimicrobiaceae bacterium]|nr:glycosyltransferase [Longimicrobiaceae bacterium]